MRPKGLQEVTSAKDYPVQRQSSRGPVRVQSLRDVTARRRIEARTIPTTHAQRLSEIAWLEREAERLQRESAIFEANLQRIHDRLTAIAERREALLQLVREGLGMSEPARSDSPPKRANSPALNGDIEVVAIEY